ncbi:unnamed protein product, partial [Rotaria sp. Silwood1]
MQKNRLSVTSCALDEYGKWSDYILHVEWGSSKPYGVLSAALTQGNDDVILIDSNNQIFCIDLSQEGQANVRSITIRDINDDPKQPKSSISTKYFAVQTVGDPPVFFFQEKHSVDIVDFNFARISCLEISNARLEYHMQVFTDFVDTYCLLLNSDNKNVAFHIQNLVSSTCIRRQDSEKNLSNVARPIGNRLLDIIKWGELKFGTNPAYIGSPDRTIYHIIVPKELQSMNLTIKKYFNDLNVSADLQISDAIDSGILMPSTATNIATLARILTSRVPLQICTIESGNIVPLSSGTRQILDHILSKKLFQIETKAKEISFSYLDDLLNNIKEKILIVGIIGRQSTGKSYMMNRIFGTRFAVAAGRCTDGLWMNHAYINNTNFIVFDCEGLFSKKRTEDEEVKLISFLAAVCDVTILNQDLSFDRNQDHLFILLSQTIDNVAKSDDFFKGVLMIAVRDINDNDKDDTFIAVEKTFLDIQ